MLEHYENNIPTREDIKHAERQLKLLKEVRDNKLKQFKEQLWEKKNRLQDAIYEINNAIKKEEHETITKNRDQECLYNELARPYNRTLHEKDFLLDCRELHMEEPELDFTAKPRYNKDDEPLEPIDTIYKDEYCRIEAYVVKNDRPKNCYTLAIVGHNHLQKLMLDQVNCYGMNLYTEGHVNIELELHFKPTREEALEKLKQKKDLILRDYLIEYKEIKAKFLEVKKDIMTDEWERIWIERRLHQLKHHYHRGQELPEWDKLQARLRELMTPEEREQEDEQEEDY